VSPAQQLRPALKGSCACCRLRASAERDYCAGCRRVVCPGCSPLPGLLQGRPHQLTDHDGWKRFGGRRPASWGAKGPGRGSARGPAPAGTGALRAGGRSSSSAPAALTSCAQSFARLSRGTRRALTSAAAAQLEHPDALQISYGGTA
jgi:hypothetical protein